MSWKERGFLECTESRPECKPCQFTGPPPISVAFRCPEGLNDKTAQPSSSAHSDRIQRDAETILLRAVLHKALLLSYSYISGLLEHRAIIQSFLMRWWHSFCLGWRPQSGRWLSAISLSARPVVQQRRCYTDVTCKQGSRDVVSTLWMWKTGLWCVPFSRRCGFMALKIVYPLATVRRQKIQLKRGHFTLLLF